MQIFKLFFKDKKGAKVEYDIGANAVNVQEDSSHRFITDVERQQWNAKLEEKDLGAAAKYAVANNDTTTVPGFLADARIVKQHGDEIDQINSDLSALNDSGAIIGMNAREDGVYITYHNGADTVIKKLGSVLYAGFLTPTSYNQNGPGNANFDLKPLLSNYASLTTANMCIEATYFKGFEARVNNLSIQGGTGYTYTYDATTGMLTVSGIGTVNYSYKSRPEKIKLVVLQDDIA